jgi:FkbM family methyltransferase
MNAARSTWWAAGSLVVIFVGAFGPWAKAFGLTVDGNDDEIVVGVALVAAIALVFFAVTRNPRVAVVSLLAGLYSATLIAHDLKDPGGPFAGPGHNIRLEWGIWTALAGSIGLTLASLVLLAETAGVRVRGGRLTRVPPATNRGRPTALARGRGKARSRVGARTRLLGAFSDDAVLRDFAKRLSRKDERGPELLAQLLEQMHLKAAGTLVEQLAPVRELDYARHRIELLVSSPEIGKRLGSVEKEPFTVQWIERWVRPGDVFYDIGANVGPYSLIAAKVTGNGARVFAFEPSASSFHDLSRNILLNGCAKSVVPLPLALWSESCLLTFTVRSLSSGAAKHRLSSDLRIRTPLAETIIGMRLDDLVERFGVPVPTHAKIDVDGYELDVLRGAEQTLARPEWRSIIVELDPEETERNGAIKALLAKAGFDSGRRHERLPTRRHPRPEERPDVYWSFRRQLSQNIPACPPSSR